MGRSVFAISQRLLVLGNVSLVQTTGFGQQMQHQMYIWIAEGKKVTPRTKRFCNNCVFIFLLTTTLWYRSKFTSSVAYKFASAKLTRNTQNKTHFWFHCFIGKNTINSAESLVFWPHFWFYSAFESYSQTGEKLHFLHCFTQIHTTQHLRRG